MNSQTHLNFVKPIWQNAVRKLRNQPHATPFGTGHRQVSADELLQHNLDLLENRKRLQQEQCILMGWHALGSHATAYHKPSPSFTGANSAVIPRVNDLSSSRHSLLAWQMSRSCRSTARQLQSIDAEPPEIRRLRGVQSDYKGDGTSGPVIFV